MFRRVLLAVSFVMALGFAGFAATDWADAHGHRHRGYWNNYNGYYGANYGGYYPNVYRSSYYPPAYYGPPVYRSSYYGGWGGHHHHCHDDGGVYISLGF